MIWQRRISFWDWKNLRSVTGGRWVYRPARRRGADQVVGLSTDSRSVGPGECFLAMRGEFFDGHDYLSEAVRRGAVLLIIDREEVIDRVGPVDVPVLLVEDSRACLLKLGAAYRKTLRKTRVIAVTGSNGKTTTVRMIDAVLKAARVGTASLKSYNNDIGVPLTILRAKPGDEYLVCEVGTNNPGEIEPLARILAPDIAVITTIGRAHIGNFGSKRALVEEKFSLLKHIRKGGTAIIPHELFDQSTVLRTVPRVVTFGEETMASVRMSSYELVASGLDAKPSSRFTLNDATHVEIPLAGRHNACNALAAIAVGLECGLSEAQACEGLKRVEPPAMRFEAKRIGGIAVINDAYNASPESMKASIETFAAITEQAPRRVLILGDMLELGDESSKLHSEIGEFLLEKCPADLVVTVGPMSLFLADVLLRTWPSNKVAMHSEMSEDSANRIASRLRPGDVVLLKGSRRMGLERIVESLQRMESGHGASRAAG